MNMMCRGISMMSLIFMGACSGGSPAELPAASNPPSASPQPPRGRPPACVGSETVKTTDELLLPGGIYTGLFYDCGTNTETPDAVAWVSEDGRIRIFASGGHMLTGSMDLQGDTFVAEGLEFAGLSLLTGSLGVPVIMNGTIVERQSLTGRWGSDWIGNGYFTFHYEPASHVQPSSFDRIAGVRTIEDRPRNKTGVWTIESDGRFNGQDETGCLESGHFGLIDDQFNLYEIELNVLDCPFAGTYTGLATVRVDDLSGTRLLDISVDDGASRARRLNARL